MLHANSACNEDGKEYYEKVINWCWWLEMDCDYEGRVPLYEQCKQRALQQFKEPLKWQTISHLWQRVSIHIW